MTFTKLTSINENEITDRQTLQNQTNEFIKTKYVNSYNRVVPHFQILHQYNGYKMGKVDTMKPAINIVSVTMDEDWHKFLDDTNLKFGRSFSTNCSFIVHNAESFAYLPTSLLRLYIKCTEECSLNDAIVNLDEHCNTVDTLRVSIDHNTWSDTPDNWLVQLCCSVEIRELIITYSEGEQKYFNFEKITTRGFNKKRLLNTEIDFSNTSNLHYDQKIPEILTKYFETGDKNQFFEDLMEAGFEDMI